MFSLGRFQKDTIDGVSTWSLSRHQWYDAHRLNVLRTPSVIQEVLSFHSTNFSGVSPKIIFVSPEWIVFCLG